MNNLGQLASELKCLILDHVDHQDLYACTTINKSFYNETMPILWRRLDIGSQDTLANLTRTMATSPSAPGNHIRTISVSWTLSDAQLLALVKHSPFLERLILKKAQRICDTSLEHFARYHLTTLDINNGVNISHMSLMNILKHCSPYLRILKLKSCISAATAAAIACLHNKDLWMGLNDCRFLEKLTMINCCYIQDATVLITHCHWSRLTHLRLDACKTLDDTLAIPFLQSHPRLRFLQLGDSQITDRTLDAMIHYLPMIREIRLPNNNSNRITHDGIRRLVTTCLTLVYGIRLDGCDIHAYDFPDLEQYTYDLAFADYGFELVWIAGIAFGNWNGDDDDDDDDEDESESADEELERQQQ